MNNPLEDISVVFENSEVIAVNKPAGLVVHADGRTEEPNLCDWIIKNFPEIANEGVGEPLKIQDDREIARPGIVHRLDRETSGVLLIAKTQKSFENLKAQFKNRDIQKVYHVFVYGQLDEREGEINEPIGRSADDFRLWSTTNTRGKKRRATTKYYVRQTGVDASFLEVHPQTGRTHQIRVHLKSRGHPVVCDSLYAKGRDCLLGFNRQALHASSISFTLLDGSQAVAETELPKDFDYALEELRT